LYLANRIIHRLSTAIHSQSTLFIGKKCLHLLKPITLLVSRVKMNGEKLKFKKFGG